MEDLPSKAAHGLLKRALVERGYQLRDETRVVQARGECDVEISRTLAQEARLF